MPTVIRNHNDPTIARTLHGDVVHKQDGIYLPSHKRTYPVLNTSMHFCYRDPSGGTYSSTLFCTCGAPSAVFAYPAYRRWTSINRGDAIACIELIQQGKHADGSHE